MLRTTMTENVPSDIDLFGEESPAEEVQVPQAQLDCIDVHKYDELERYKFPDGGVSDTESEMTSSPSPITFICRRKKRIPKSSTQHVESEDSEREEVERYRDDYRGRKGSRKRTYSNGSSEDIAEVKHLLRQLCEVERNERCLKELQQNQEKISQR